MTLTFTKKLLFVVFLIFFSAHLSAQCPAGQANVTIKVYGDQWVDTENGITCTINGAPVTLSPTTFAATTTTRWHVFTVPCQTVGGNIVVNLTDAFGDGITSSVSGENVFVYVNNELVDSLLFSTGASASTASHNTAFTTNPLPNTTCATAQPNSVAVYASGATVSVPNSIALNAASQHGGFTVLPGVPVTQCGTFVATAANMEMYTGISFTSSSPTGGTAATVVNPTIKVYDNTCTQVGPDITTSGGVQNGLVIGNTYTICGTRYANENTGFPTYTSETTALILAARPITITPLTLLEFYGIGSDNENVLYWTSTNESNLRTIELQRSADGVNYTGIKNIAPNNVSGVSKYSANDKNFVSDNNYYRLKIIDQDGSFVYSNIVTLRNKIKTLKLISTFPNPAVNDLWVNFVSPVKQQISFTILDNIGRVVKKGFVQIDAGNTKTKVDVASLSSGAFFVKFSNSANELVGTEKIIKK